MRTRRSNAWWSVTGNGFYTFCQWAMLVVLAKLGSPRIVGQFAFGLALTAPVFLFANLQIRAIQATDTAEEYSFGDYLGLRLATTVAAAVTICVVIAVMERGDGPQLRATIAVSLAKGFEAVSDIFHGDLQRRERMDSVARYLAVKGFFSLLALALAVRFFHTAAAAAAAMAVVFASVLCFGESRYAAAPARPRWNLAAMQRLSTTALPLGLAMMLISLTANMPRYFVERSLGTESLGIFAALTSLSLAGGILINSIGLAETPRLARLFASDDRTAFSKALARMSAIALSLAVIGVAIILVAGKPVLTILFGEAYAAHLQIAAWIMAAGGLFWCASVLGYGLTAAHCFRPQLPLFAGVAAVAAATSYLFIPRLGLAGAALVQIITAAAQLIGSAVMLMVVMRRASDLSVTPEVLV